MKLQKHKSGSRFKQRIYVQLLIVLSLISLGVKAQGWTFDFQLAYSGNCAGAGSIVLPQFPKNTFQTQAQCESLRQQILAITASGGGCTVYYKCTPCTGSDIVNPSESNPGDISFNLNNGKPFFVPHQSKAFEEWSKNYKDQLAAYGITSILGQSITPNGNLPMSGNAKVNKKYGEDAEKFKPKGAVKKENTQPKTEKVKDEYGTIDPYSLTSDAMIKRRDEWYEKNGFNTMKTISPTEGLEDKSPAESSSAAEKLKSLLDKLPYTPLQSEIKEIEETFVNKSFETIGKAINGEIPEDQLGNLHIIALTETGKTYIENKATGMVVDKMTEKATDYVKSSGIAIMGKIYGDKGAEHTKTGIEVSEKAIEIWSYFK